MKTKLNIYYITDAILDDRIVHAVHVDEVAKSITSIGHSVTLYAPFTNTLTLPKKYSIRFIPKSSWLVSPIYQIRLFFRLYRDMRTEKPNIIYVRQSLLLFIPTILAEMFHIPIVFEVNGRLIEEAYQINNGFLYRLFFASQAMYSIEYFNMSTMAACIVVSTGIKEYLLKTYTTNPDKVTVVSNGVDTEIFKPIPPFKVRSKLNLDENALYIGYIGSLYSWQGVPYVIEAAKILSTQRPEVRFLIVGDGSDVEKITRFIKDNHLENIVDLRPAIAHDAVPEYINALDICISYPLKIRANAASPFKVYEYLACGKPIVVSDIGGIKEEFGSALLYAEAESPKALAEVLIVLIDSAQERERMSQAARKFIEEGHSWQSIAEKTIAVFERAALLRQKKR